MSNATPAFSCSNFDGIGAVLSVKVIPSKLPNPLWRGDDGSPHRSRYAT
jgi:hypothetical protein